MKSKTSLIIGVVLAVLLFLPGCDSGSSGGGGAEVGVEVTQCSGIAGHWNGHMTTFGDSPQNYLLTLVITESHTRLTGTATLVGNNTTYKGRFTGQCTDNYWEILIQLDSDSTADFDLIGYHSKGTAHGDWESPKTGVSGMFWAEKQ